MDECLASQDAGPAEIAGEFLLSIRGEEKRGRAVQQGDECQRQRSVLFGGAAELSGNALLHEFERRHVFLARERDGPIFGDEPVVVGMGSEEVENAAANLHGSARGIDSRKKMQASTTAKEREKVVLVEEAFIESRSGSASGAGDAAHGQGGFASFAPQAVCGRKDAAF